MLMMLVVAAIVFVERPPPGHGAIRQRVVGGRMYGGSSTHIRSK
jgi:hypothetical protein